jgi:hypothetical protein
MPLLLLQETGVTLAQRRRCRTRDGAFLHLCNLSGFFWIWSFYTKRARGESEIPATALDVFTDKADPAWDDFDVSCEASLLLR